AVIVVPKAVLYQWFNVMTKKFLRRNVLRMCFYYGSKKRSISDEMLATYDVVLTSYTTLKFDVMRTTRKGEVVRPAKRLVSLHWKRFILDEAHQAKSHETKNSKACRRIKADVRWCVTGTPMNGRVEDLESLFK
ncbi:helicase-like protein, partial [Aphelenchoides avenae]